MRRRPELRTLAAVLTGVVVLAACTPEPDPIDVTAEDAGVPEQVAPDDAIDVFAVAAPDEVPPPDADLFSGSWPEAAAWIAREAEDGRPTLVNIFASWCGPCRNEMPLLVQASRDNPDVAFLGIDHVDPIDQGRAFVEEFEIPFATIHDLGGDVAFAVGSRGMPTTVVFDRDGRLVGRVVGEVAESALDELLDEIR